MNLIKKYRVKINKEKNEAGVVVWRFIWGNYEHFRRHFAEKGSRKEKKANEWNRALEICQIAKETMGQTKKQCYDDEKAPKQKRWRRSNSETMDFLRQKLELVEENLVAEREEKRNQNAILMNLIGQQQQMMAQQMAVFREIINKNN